MFNLLNCIYSFFIEQRRNYKNVFNAFARIAKEEGITTLWRGSVATMGRAVIVNISQLATYSQAKFLIATKSYYEFLNFLIYYIYYLFFSKRIYIKYIIYKWININRNSIYIFYTVNIPESVELHFFASMLSGFLTTFNSMPFDIAKTR